MPSLQSQMSKYVYGLSQIFSKTTCCVFLFFVLIKTSRTRGKEEQGCYM